MELSKEHQRRLGDLYGYLPNGTPRLRIVTPDEAKRPHGKLAGTYKYLNPETGGPMECLMLVSARASRAKRDVADRVARPISYRVRQRLLQRGILGIALAAYRLG